jgi:hypothetical protein
VPPERAFLDSSILVGRGPTHSRADYAGRDVLVCTLEDALLHAERAMIQMGNKEVPA